MTPPEALAGIDNTSVLTSIHEANANQWNNLVSQSDRGNVFFRHGWLAAIEAGFDYEPRHVVVRKGDNPIAVLPNFVSPLELPHDGADAVAATFGISVMTSTEPGYGGPLALTDERTSVDRLLDAVEAMNDRRVLYHLIRTYDLENIRYGRYLRARGYEPVLDDCLFLIDLGDDWEAIREGMDKERRKAMREATDQDYRVEIDPLGADLDRTYAAYARNIERVGGDRLPRAFFDALSDEFEDRIRVFTAVVDGEEAGRYVHLLDRENGVLHHWLSAIPEESDFESYPSELLHQRAIKWGIEEGYDDYNFGPTGSFFENSVFRFKNKYGGRTVPLLRWQKGEVPVLWPMYKLGKSRFMRRQVEG